ncbi:MAG: ABC-type transporter, integral rane subunit [Gemmatimonadetes bacterium]|nr:ABC-type transporter, integral rane subunit [Gemmatimonadota bacterium]
MRYHRVRSPALLRAFGRAMLLFWCVLSLTFALLRLAPGDPTTFLIPAGAGASDAVRMRAELGLDQSTGVQYARWLGALLHGDLGGSFVNGRPVRSAIGDALPVSVALGGASLLLSFLIGIAAGLIQAARRGSRLDATLTVASVLLAASPAYWLGLGAIACFTYLASSWSLPLMMRLPAIGMTTPGADLHGVAHLSDLVRHSILPVTLLAAIGAGGVARYVRTSALDAGGTDWMRTARAKGAGEGRVYRHHLLANLRAPILTLFALSLPGTVAGSVFVETIFAWPGMGRLMVTSIVARDYPVVMGCAAMFAALVIVANLAAEALLPWADPRVRA